MAVGWESAKWEYWVLLPIAFCPWIIVGPFLVGALVYDQLAYILEGPIPWLTLLFIPYTTVWLWWYHEKRERRRKVKHMELKSYVVTRDRVEGLLKDKGHDVHTNVPKSSKGVLVDNQVILEFPFHGHQASIDIWGTEGWTWLYVYPTPRKVPEVDELLVDISRVLVELQPID